MTPTSSNSLTPTGTVTVTASPGGTNCTATLPATSCSLTFSSVGTRTIAASYSGDANFAGSTSSSVSLSVRNFNVYVVPPSKAIFSGGSGTYSMTVVGAGGFTGQVALSCAGGPPGATCTTNPASVNLSSSTTSATSTATVTVPAGTAKGTYNLTFTGSYGGVSRTANAVVRVTK